MPSIIKKCYGCAARFTDNFFFQTYQSVASVHWKRFREVFVKMNIYHSQEFFVTNAGMTLPLVERPPTATIPPPDNNSPYAVFFYNYLVTV